MTLDPGLAAIAAAMIQVLKAKDVKSVAAVIRDAKTAIELADKPPEASLPDARPAVPTRRKLQRRRGSAQAA